MIKIRLPLLFLLVCGHFVQAQSTLSKTKSIALQPRQPVLDSLNGGTLRLLVDSSDTNGEWSLVELLESPGYKTPLHRHTWDESFYILEGTLVAKVGDSLHRLPAGSFLLIPRGTPHAQGNEGAQPVRFLLTMRPAGFERHLKDRVALYKRIRPGQAGFEQAIDSLRKKNSRYIETLQPWQLPAKP